MSRQTPLTLTEELEKLEQSITLTLQEIDHNFSKAHRIVTTSILPIVEQYAGHSHDVWEGSKFWKQFFESSANVSLSGYEEQPSTQDNLEDTGNDESNAISHSTLETSETYTTPSSAHYSMQENELDVDLSTLSMSPSHSTPRPPKGKKVEKQPIPSFADYPSPYETLRREVNEHQAATDEDPSHQEDPSTPTTSSAITDQSRDITMTPSQLYATTNPSAPSSLPRPSTAHKKTDPLLHRVLDRNYRVQATPLRNARYGGFANPQVAAAARARGGPETPATAARTQVRNRLLEANLSSSPEIPEPPQLHAEIFASPSRKRRTVPNTNSNPIANKPRTPGVSVLTPARPRDTGPGTGPATATAGIWDSDEEGDDDDDDGGLPFGQSPPKTMQFYVPQSRLLKTPGE